MAKEKKASRGTSDGMMLMHSKKEEKPKPTLHVDEKDLPAIKKWQVGKKYHVKAHVEMRSHSKGDDWGEDSGKKKHSAVLVLHKLEEVSDKHGDGSDDSADAE